MSGDAYSPPIYLCKVEELIPFENQKTAEIWMNENEVNITGTPLLVPFKNLFGQIEFLKPDDPQDCLRIMGAGNYVKSYHWFGKSFNWIEKQFKRDFAPHVNNLLGNSIKLAQHGFIVIYERGEEPAGHKFGQLFRKENEDLKNQIKITQTNDGPHLNPAKFIQDISQLALDLKIKAGMNFFILEDKKGKQRVYRHTFKEGVANSKIAFFLAAEKKRFQSHPVRVHNNKTIDHHVISFLKDIIKWFVFVLIISIMGGLILTIFISSTIAGPVSFLAFMGLSFAAICKALKDNKNTIKFGEPEFETFKPEVSIFYQLKAEIVTAYRYLFGELKGENSKERKCDVATSQAFNYQAEVTFLNDPELSPISTELNKPKTIEPSSGLKKFLFFKKSSLSPLENEVKEASFEKRITKQNLISPAG